MKKAFLARIFLRLTICVGLLAAGFIVMMVLAQTREDPARAEISERPIRVEVISAKVEDMPVEIVGYGEVRAKDTVAIGIEVPGRVVEVHPRLEVGEVIPEGETLFKIDPRNFKARVSDAEATAARLQATIARLNSQYESDQDRLNTVRRNRDLAQAEYERVRRLFDDDQVGTQSGVDAAERAWNAAQDQLDQLSEQVRNYPIQIQEVQSSLASARAQLELAQADLDRTQIEAPFNARVKSVNLEAGQYVSPGVQVLSLADDSVLEISVPLDSREAQNWLEFGSAPKTAASKAWFNSLKQVPVEIQWTEDQGNHVWKGILDRVEKFDQQTRTLTVVVRATGQNVNSVRNGSLPLVEGMFCKVSIPGRTAQDVVQVPSEAVGFDEDATGFRTVYIASPAEAGELRLKTAKVVESHIDNAYTYISEGINQGDLVVVTRLVNPLENSLLETSMVGAGQDADS